jgi:hypothetical protein
VALAIFLPIFRILLATELLLYILILAAAGIHSAIQQKKSNLAIGLPLAIATMHITWGWGFLWSMIKGIFSNQNPENN